MTTYQINTEADRKMVMAKLTELDTGEYTVEIKRLPKQRTLTQNGCLHKWCEQMADSFNDAGYDQRAVMEQMKEGVSIPWTMDAVKNIFREVAKAMHGVESTADLTTTQIQDVHVLVNDRFHELTGVSHPWPSIDSLRDRSAA